MVSVAANVSGEITQIIIRENQPVKAGDVLFQIDPEPCQIAVAEAEALATVVGVPVISVDERRTTVTAERAMKEASMRAEDRRKVVDKVAAAVMLQHWLDGRPRPQDRPS